MSAVSIWASVSVLVAGCCIMGCWTVQNTDILMSWIIWITYYRIGRLSTVWQKPWSQECHYDVGDISDQGHHNILQQEGKKISFYELEYRFNLHSKYELAETFATDIRRRHNSILHTKWKPKRNPIAPYTLTRLNVHSRHSTDIRQTFK